MANPKDGGARESETNGPHPGFRYYLFEAKLPPPRSAGMEWFRQLAEYRNAVAHGAIDDARTVLVVDAAVPVEATGIEIVPAEDAPSTSAPASTDQRVARREPRVLETALFYIPKALRDGFIGDLREELAQRKADGWSWRRRAWMAASQIAIMAVVGLWRAGVLKAMGILRLFGY